MFLEVLLRQNLTLTAHYEGPLVLLTRINLSHFIFQYLCS